MPMPPPNQDTFRELAAESDRGPVVMLNLLKFAGRVGDDGGGDEGGAESSGREEYSRYTEEARKQVERRGGRLLWQGRVRFTLIGGEEWWRWCSTQRRARSWRCCRIAISRRRGTTGRLGWPTRG